MAARRTPRSSQNFQRRSPWPSRKGSSRSALCRGGRGAPRPPQPGRAARYDGAANLRRPRGRAGSGDARPRARLRDRAGRRPVRARARAQLQHRRRRQPQLRVGRVRQLCRNPRGSNLPPGPAQHRGRDRRLAGARGHPGDRRRPGVPRYVPGEALCPLRAPLALGRAGLARGDRLDLDLRFDLQRDQLDAQGRRPAARLAVLARGARARPHRHHHRAGLADFPLREGDRARRAGVDPAGDRRGGGRGRRRVLAALVPDRAAVAAPGRRGRRAVRRGVHGDRSGGRLHPHRGRAGQHHPRAADPRLPAGDPRGRSRAGGGDRGVPAPLLDRGRGRHAPAGPPRRGGRGGPMTRAALRGVMKRAALYAAAFGFIGFAGFPFYWMLITAFKQNRDLYVGASDLSHVPWIFNDPPTLDHVKLLFGQTEFLRWVLNTLVVVAAVVVITVAVAVPAGYSLARLAGRWGERMGMGIFFTYLIPPTLLFIPFSRVISLLGLQNSLGALVLIYPTMTIPFCTWLVMGFLRSVPWEIEEQAMIDGYSRLAVILKVAPRLIVPGILTVVVFTFTLVLQEFVYALTFLSSVERMTVSLGVPVALVRGDVYHWGALMAAALFTSIPLAIVYNLFIDRFIQGFTMGAVKG